MKEYSEAEIKSKAEVYCSSVERCPSDVEEKIRKWGASEEVTERIMAHLQKERYGSFLPLLRARQVPFQSVGTDEDCTDAPYETPVGRGHPCRTGGN